MGKFGGHFAKSNKADRERQILYNITYIWNLFLKTDFIGRENRMVVARVVGRGEIG